MSEKQTDTAERIWVDADGDIYPSPPKGYEDTVVAYVREDTRSTAELSAVTQNQDQDSDQGEGGESTVVAQTAIPKDKALKADL